MSERSTQVLSEIGTLWADPNGDSRFVGSASGIYFLRTVQSAFSNATSTSSSTLRDGRSANAASPRSHWSPEQIFASEEAAASASTRGIRPVSDLQRCSFFEPPPQLPAHDVAKSLTKLYFETWHSMAPSLHGPSFLREMEQRFANAEKPPTQSHSNMCWNVIFQCVWNLALLDASEETPRSGLYDCSPEQLVPVLGAIALHDTLISIQTLLSAQLLFIATMSLRSASIAGGLIVRAMMKAGLHRCPFRYSDIPAADRDMRKRIFWTAYVLDRFLSQSLGQPLSIQDSDVDVCPPGISDLHTPVQQPARPPDTVVDAASMHLPSTHPQFTPVGEVLREEQSTIDPIMAPFTTTSHNDATQENNSMMRRRENQFMLSNLVASSRFLGRALEIFHKSIHVRSASAHDILLLKVDIETWANDSVHSWTIFPQYGREEAKHNLTATSLKSSVFSLISYYQLQLFINRPSLSVRENQADSKLALQTCISASRSILQALRTYTDSGHRIFWPGHLLAIWMSGLVIAFACRLNSYDVEKSITGLSQALSMLKTSSLRWPQAATCHAVLSELLNNVKAQRVTSMKNLDNSNSSEITNQRSLKRKTHDVTINNGGCAPYKVPRSNGQDRMHENTAPEPHGRDRVSRGQSISIADMSSRPLYNRDGPRQTPSAQFGGFITSPNTPNQRPNLYNDRRSDGRPSVPSFNAQDNFAPDFTTADFNPSMWPEGFNIVDNRGAAEDLDFMVWDSLQQLVTNLD